MKRWRWGLIGTMLAVSALALAMAPGGGEPNTALSVTEKPAFTLEKVPEVTPDMAKEALPCHRQMGVITDLTEDGTYPATPYEAARVELGDIGLTVQDETVAVVMSAAPHPVLASQPPRLAAVITVSSGGDPVISMFARQMSGGGFGVTYLFECADRSGYGR